MQNIIPLNQLTPREKKIFLKAKKISNLWCSKLNLIYKNHPKLNQEIAFHILEMYSSTDEMAEILERIYLVKTKKEILELLVEFEVATFEHYQWHCKQLKKSLAKYFNEMA